MCFALQFKKPLNIGFVLLTRRNVESGIFWNRLLAIGLDFEGKAAIEQTADGKVLAFRPSDLFING
jgi:hypothetical protein